ncbi:restriction endonuclease subunit S [Clostridium tertium]|uniref:restriction endonuclease subunit S n=1 Tax=Clostridium tertium TaxID=1559 RepID=UPI00232EAC46|nr:restriction endonuclease subunit S [Clostridium tertium]MDB1954223.1 restriction endonuclease subunit S [Clostridium tertium]MDB1957860.1 restriction endonuclease subunit S [Clostridium tertium]MDB1961688.1 restriction endonuclease subunit S [Clostridium tertium]MDB1965031.1 restriction endonuclease subunit S [Clostridium tertium]
MYGDKCRYLSLGEICEYSKEKIEIGKINRLNYISTENMLPNKEGIVEASSIPNTKTVTYYQNADILVSNIRPYFKKIWYANKSGGASNDVLVFKIKDKNIIDSKYIYYNLIQDIFFDYVMSGAKGTKMPRGDKDAIFKYEIRVPELQEQIKITNILSSLDDKIELNNEMNKTLEEMAQTLFKRWFVDFEFPNEDGEPYKSSGGEMVKSELGMIPKGWMCGSLGDLCEIASSKRIFMKDYVQYGIPFFRGKEVIEKSKGKSISTELFITEEKYNEIKEKFGVPEKNDILLTSVGTLGVSYLVNDERFYFKDGNLTWFKSFKDYSFNIFVYEFLNSTIGKIALDEITIGSTQKALTISSLKQIKIIIPNIEILRRFYNISGSFIDNIRINENNREKLIELRDSLLPKIMSGEIRVEEIEANL